MHFGCYVNAKRFLCKHIILLCHYAFTSYSYFQDKEEEEEEEEEECTALQVGKSRVRTDEISYFI
jgi:cation transport regulator ChaB